MNLKAQNYHMLKDWANHQKRPDMTGSKLHALYKYIQKKGELIQSDDAKLNGVKCVKISGSEFIALKRTGSPDKFFPCAIKTIILTIL